MVAVEVRTRTRLAPEVRWSLILDDAARLILEEGLTAVSMERLGRERAVSKALVYNDFPSREFVLAALLQREPSDLDSRGAQGAIAAQSYEALIWQTTRVCLEHTKARGALVQALLPDPPVVRWMQAKSAALRERTIGYFVKETRREFSLSLPVAIGALDLFMSLTERAGKQVAEGSMDIDTAKTMVVQIITDGLRKLADGLAHRPLWTKSDIGLRQGLPQGSRA